MIYGNIKIYLFVLTLAASTEKAYVLELHKVIVWIPEIDPTYFVLASFPERIVRISIYVILFCSIS